LGLLSRITPIGPRCLSTRTWTTSMALPMAGVVGSAEYTECTGVGPRARSPTGKNGMPACAELMMRCRAFELSRPGVAARSITESGHQGKIRGAGSREFRLNERRIRRDDAFLGGRKYIFCIRGGEMVPGNLRAGTFSLPLSVRGESTRAACERDHDSGAPLPIFLILR
jgi:hypothetical protein